MVNSAKEIYTQGEKWHLMGRWLKDIEVVRMYKKVELRLQQGIPLVLILRNLGLSYNTYNRIKKKIQGTSDIVKINNECDGLHQDLQYKYNGRLNETTLG